MLKTQSQIIALAAGLGLLASPAFAQDSTNVETLKPAESRKKRVVRVVEAIPMWVDAEKLRVRDNPYAGDVVGMLQLGQKVTEYPPTGNRHAG